MTEDKDREKIEYDTSTEFGRDAQEASGDGYKLWEVASKHLGVSPPPTHLKPKENQGEGKKS